MEKQDFQYDKAGRLSKEDELMMSHPNKDLCNVIGMVDPSSMVSIAIVDKSSFENARKKNLHPFTGEETNLECFRCFLFSMVDSGPSLFAALS
jgi:hypothetical protein